MNKTLGVIFDCDGIVADTEPMHYQARVEAFNTLGLTLSRQEYIEKGMSRHFADFLGATVPLDTLAPTQYEEFYRSVIQANYLRLRRVALQPILGAKDFVCRMAAAGFTIGVASTQPRDVVLEVLEKSIGEAARLFQIVQSGEGLAHNKPAPDVYLVTAQKLCLNPSCCVAIEDSPSGVRSARAAGMACIARRNEWASDASLVRAGATLLVPDYNMLTSSFVQDFISENQ